MKHSSDISELKKMQRASLLKMIVIAVIVVFSSVAWFAMNREVEGAGVQMTADDLPYELETPGESGFYKSKYDLLHSNAMEWKISTAHNLYYSSKLL